jgi:hypothetical protein
MHNLNVPRSDATAKVQRGHVLTSDDAPQASTDTRDSVRVNSAIRRGLSRLLGPVPQPPGAADMRNGGQEQKADRRDARTAPRSPANSE